MPAMRFLKSLGKLLRENALEEETFREKIYVERLRAAKVFPFRLYAAWAALPDSPPPNRPFAERLGEGAEHPVSIRAHLAATLDAYARAFDWGAFNRGSWVVAPDVSGSMVSPIGGSAHLRFTEVSGMFTGFFSAGLEKVTVSPFDTEARSYRLGREASVLDHVRAIGKMTGGGTYLEAPILEMLRKGIDVDNALFITDSEEWGKGWLGLWKQYRRRNPAAKAFLLRLDAYRTQPFPPDEAESLGIHQIFGWSDTVVDYMRLALEK